MKRVPVKIAVLIAVGLGGTATFQVGASHGREVPRTPVPVASKSSAGSAGVQARMVDGVYILDNDSGGSVPVHRAPAASRYPQLPGAPRGGASTALPTTALPPTPPVMPAIPGPGQTSASTLAAQRAQGEKELRAAYRSLIQARLAYNYEAIMRHYAPDYQMVVGPATLTREVFALGQWATCRQREGGVQPNIRIKRITWKGADAEVLIREPSKLVMPDDKGRREEMTLAVDCLDYWSRYSDGWKIRRTIKLEKGGTINGKPA